METQAELVKARFAGFELELRSGELIKDGRRVRLQEQPFRLLKLLLDQPGEVISREELQRQLWPAETFVDFDHGLNKAVGKLREVLDERDAESSLIETLPRRGYRFTTQVEWVGSQNGRNQVTQPLPVKPGQRWSRFVVAAGLIILVAATAWIYLSRRYAQAGKIHSIAVLPLANLSGDPSQEYLADGITDELITNLAKNHAWQITSRTTVMQYKGVKRPLRDIASELKVDGILEGSMTRSGDRVHMTVQLIYAPTDTHVWAESYDRDLNGIFALPAELSQTIAKELEVAAASNASRSINAEAHDAYLRGRFFWFADDYGQSQDFFQKAIKLQPDYAAPWSGLADVYTVQAVAGLSPSIDVRDKAEAAALKAVSLERTLPEAQNAMAAVHFFLNWKWKEADTWSQRAVALTPTYAEAHHLRSYILFALNRPDEALLEQRKASELEPYARPFALGAALIHVRRFDEAIKELRTRVDNQPHDATLRFMLSRAYHFNELPKESAHEMEEGFIAAGDENRAGEVRQIFQRDGEKGVALWRLNRAKKTLGQRYFPSYALAERYALLGLKAETLSALEAAYQERSAQLVFLQNDPEFDFLHSEDRYRTIVNNMGLPPSY